MLVLHNLLAMTKFERSPSPLTFPHLAFPVFDPFSWLSLFSSFSFAKYKTFIISPYLSHFPPFPLWLPVPFPPPILLISRPLFSRSPTPYSPHLPPVLPISHPLFSWSPDPYSPDLPPPILLISPLFCRAPNPYSPELPPSILPISHPLFSRCSTPYLPISPHILPSSRPLFSRAPTPCSPGGEKGFQRFGSWLSKLTIY